MHATTVQYFMKQVVYAVNSLMRHGKFVRLPANYQLLMSWNQKHEKIQREV